jgi:poly-gamma-glutamate capsule biosynthesis protein CapA/YwtB (metallophosphatase superfamily)
MRIDRDWPLVVPAAAGLLLALGPACAQEPRFGPADPIIKRTEQFDTQRPISAELRTHVPDGFVIGAVGDLIISRPLSQYAKTLPAFRSVLDLLQRSTVVYGNMETTIFDPRSFKGAPFSWDGDWTNAALPAVARDLKSMGFAIVSRANNHALDWGLEGMRESSRWLDEAGIVHAGVGETRGLARAPQYLESAAGRVALISLASTFRPTTDALPSAGASTGRAGVNALHLTMTVAVPPAAMQALAQVDCVLYAKHCGRVPADIELFTTKYRQADAFSYEYAMDPEDLAEIYKSIRAARENADFVIVSIHSHECSVGCDDDAEPRGAAQFLKQLAHGAIDSGADIFVTTGNHNLGPIELYNSPARGVRPIFYGLGNFIWSDVQELLPHDLFQSNRTLLGQAWVDPGKATEYDLTAPLNKASFAHPFTFQSVVAQCRFDGNQLSEIRLHPIEEGYGSKLTMSGIPRLVTDPAIAARILDQITEQTAQFGLPKLNLTRTAQGGAVVRP